MSDVGESAGAEVLFRTNKRRKISRKRNVDPQDVTSTEYGSDLPRNATSSPPQVVKRPASRKHGIGFNSTGRSTENTTTSERTSLVTIQKDQEQLSEINRFVKPASKVEVVEDKHLTAYVDSKLAELRSSGQAPIPSYHGNVNSNAVSTSSEHQESTVSRLASADASGANGQASIQRRQNQTSRQTKSRRGPRPKDPSELARNAMVDSIFAESQVPLYSHSADAPVLATASEGIDNDEAAATAFKQQFLQDLAERNRRKRAPAPPKDPKGAAQVPSGPRLGGSRQQRGKMKALEEARNAVPGSGSGSAKRS